MTFEKVKVDERRLHSGCLCQTICLAAPHRSNALDPILLKELRAAFGKARETAAGYVILTAVGRNFSTGGDVSLFRAAQNRSESADYAAGLVGTLQALVLDMITLPAIVVCAAQGATTGGSAGLLFAADHLIMSEDAFVQPYYTEVGFAPDGGWTALLPEKIGAGAALDMQLANRRIPAETARSLRLAHRITGRADLARAADQTVENWDHAHILDAMLATKKLIWDAARVAQVRRRLDAEQAAFCAQIDSESAIAGVSRFLAARGNGGTHV